MRSYPLNTFATAVLDSNGNGTAQATPPPNTRWTVQTVGVQTNQNPNDPTQNIPTCNIYIGGAPISANFVDGTFTGNQDSTDQTAGIPIYAGQSIYAVWANGPVGALATLSLYGTSDSGYRE